MSNLNLKDVPVRYIPDFCSYDVEKLWNQLPFKNHDNAPRQECWFNDYGLDYTYGHGRGERTYSAELVWDDFVNSVREKLNKEFDSSYDCCFCNGYVDENNHLGWHADDSPEMDMNHGICSVSIGAEREIWFRKTGEKGVAEKGVLLESGSAVIMLPGMQKDWEHRIPKNSFPCGKRISLTFRKLVV